MKIQLNCQLKKGKKVHGKQGERYYPGDPAIYLVKWTSGNMSVLGRKAIALLGALRLKRHGVTITALPYVGPQWEPKPKPEPTPVRPPLADKSPLSLYRKQFLWSGGFRWVGDSIHQGPYIVTCRSGFCPSSIPGMVSQTLYNKNIQHIGNFRWEGAEPLPFGTYTLRVHHVYNKNGDEYRISITVEHFKLKNPESPTHDTTRITLLERKLEAFCITAKQEQEQAVEKAVKEALAAERDRVKVTRTIEYEGRRDWVETTMAKSISGKMECGSHGTITETSRVVHTPAPLYRMPNRPGTKLGELAKGPYGDTCRWTPMNGWELFIRAIPCCEHDTDGDGNCHFHSAPGVWRIGGPYGRGTTMTSPPYLR